MFPFLMLVAGAGTLALAAYAWSQRVKPSVRVFALMLAAISLWLICIGSWSMSQRLELAEFWFKLQFLGVAPVPVLFLTYVLVYTGRTGVLAPARQSLLWVVPLLTQLLIWSNDRHGLMFESVTFTSRDGVMTLERWVAGPWFLLHSGYSFVLVGIGVARMVQSIIRSPGIFRRQFLTLLIAIIPPILLTLLNTFQILPPDRLVTPIGFLLTGAVIIWSVLRHEMISVAPLARDMLIDQLDDSMLVIDDRGRVVDVNPAMARLIGRAGDALLSLPLSEALPHMPRLRDAIQAALHAPSGLLEVEVERLGQQRHYDLRRSAIRSRGETVGHLFVLHDITSLKLAQANLLQLAAIDALTGLHNRRHFLQLAAPQLDSAIQEHRQLSLLLFDIDRFKTINDRYGHEAGDHVLIAVAELTRSVLRAGDLICRYGGEEFVALLMDSDAAEAFEVAERLRGAIADAPVQIGPTTVRVTISVGVVTHAHAAMTDLQTLLRLADQAMYAAKQAGRNRVASHESAGEPPASPPALPR